MLKKFQPSIGFNTEAGETARSYTSIVANSKITDIACYRGQPGEEQAKPPEQYGRNFRAERPIFGVLNGGPPVCKRLPRDKPTSQFMH
ncbi:MAG TPA: VOC family protein [Chthoniobacterales bacterium]